MVVETTTAHECTIPQEQTSIVSTSRVSFVPFVVGLIAVLPYLLLLWPGDQVLKDSLYSDYEGFQLPVREFVAQEMRAGRFPHWIPWLGCGIPLHATQQLGICYPLSTPLLWLFDANTAIKFSLFLHVVLCYWGQYRLSRQLKLSVAGASLAALVCSQSGVLCAHFAVGHLALVFAFALLPWFFSSIVEICERPSARSAAQFAAVVGGFLLLGHPQIPYYALLFGGLWVAGSLTVGVAATRRTAVVSALAAGLITGIAIGGVQLVPAWELLRENAGESPRGTVEYAATYALDGLDLYRTVIPSLFGNQMVGLPEYEPPDFYHEKYFYPGIITWCLATVALFSHSHARWPMASACLILLGFVIALGDATPVFSWLCSAIPGLPLFRCPGRCLSVAAILLSLLAGRGFDALTQIEQRIRRSSEVVLVISLLILVVAVGFVADSAAARIDSHRWWEFLKQNLLPDLFASATMILAAVAVCVFLRPSSRRIMLLATVAVVAMDLGYFNLRCIQVRDPSNPEIPKSIVQEIGQDRMFDGDTGFRSSKIRYSRRVPAAIRSKVRMIGTNEGGVLPKGCEILFQTLESNRDQALNIAACRFIASQKATQQSEIRTALPRIWFCPEVLNKLCEKSAKSLTDFDVNALLSVIGDTQVEVVADESQRIVVKTSTAVSGTLIVADTWYPDWQCHVNGEDREIFKAFDCFRRVQVDAGLNTIELSFQPTSFMRGVWISGTGLGVLFILWMAQRLRFPESKNSEAAIS